VLDEDSVDEVLDRGILEVLPLTHIRGRSLHDAFVIVDEADALLRGETLALLRASLLEPLKAMEPAARPAHVFAAATLHARRCEDPCERYSSFSRSRPWASPCRVGSCGASVRRPRGALGGRRWGSVT
jgi:hypothetical protein